MTGFEAAAFGHIDVFLIGEGNAKPGIVGRIGAGAFGEGGHFGADADGVDLAEETGEGFGDAARAEGAGFVSDQSLLESTM